MKQCKKCNEIKDYSEYYMTRNYYEPTCKPCKRKSSIEYKDKIRDKVRADAKVYYSKNREAHILRSINYQQKHIEDKVSVYHIPEYNYIGITNRPYNRESWHRSSGKIFDKLVILHQFDNRVDAENKELEYHNMGYNG